MYDQDFSSVVATTRETQLLELWGKPVLGSYVVMIIYLGEGREGRSFKQVVAVGCFDVLMVNNGVQSGRKQVESSKTKSWQEVLYRKNDSAIIAYKKRREAEKTSKCRRCWVKIWIWLSFEGVGLLETVSNAISITLYHRNCAAAFAMAPHRAVTVDARGAGDPKFRDLCTVCPELASRRG